MKPKKVFYWQGILGNAENIKQYSETIIKVLTGKCHGGDFEKLKGHHVYSARVNHSDRLLFTFIQVNGKSYLMLLDVVKNHDYHKSRFLKPSVLKHYLEKNKEAFESKIINEESFDSISPGDLPFLFEDSLLSEEIKPTEITFFDHKFIEFSGNQQEVLESTLPLIVNGAPGSGKSCLAISRLIRATENRAEGDLSPILYLAESPFLVKAMKEVWMELPGSQDLHQDLVHFLTYEELYKSINPTAAGKTIVVEEDFKHWLNNHIVRYKKFVKANPKIQKMPEEALKNFKAMYEEFKIIAGCKTLEEYKKMGKKQSLFHEPFEKDWLYGAYRDYQFHLEKEQKVQLSLCQLDVSGSYGLIFVDEFQDLSPLQLESLYHLAIDGQICYLGDTRQLLIDQKSKLPYLINMLRSSHTGEVRHILLPCSYRCPKKIKEVADALIRLRTFLTGGMADKYENPEIILSDSQEKGLGNVYWINPSSSTAEIELLEIRKRAQSPNLAVITQEKYKAEAREYFGTSLVFTPEESKGLQYETIVVYKLFDNDNCYEANTILSTNPSLDLTKHTHRAKTGVGEERFGPYFNGIFTTFTRSMESLIIYQEKSHEIKQIVRYFEPFMSEKLDNVVYLSTKQNWEDEATKLEKKGFIQEASEIRKEKKLDLSAEVDTPSTSTSLPEPLVSKKQSKTISEKAKPPIQNKTKSKLALRKSQPPEKIIKAKATKAPSNLSELALKCYTNCTVNNIKAIFDYKLYEKVLFDIAIDGGANLFTSLLYVEKIEFLGLFFKKYPEYAKKIKGHQLCKIFNGIAPIQRLFIFKEGISLLNALLEHNLDAIKEITAGTLCQPITISELNISTTSILFDLMMSDDGKRQLKKMNDANPLFFSDVPTDYFFKVMRAVKFEDNLSILYCLSSNDDGRSILSHLVESRKDFISENFYAALFRTRAFGPKKNASAFHWLTKWPEGQLILKKLIEDYDLASHLSFDILTKSLTTKAAEESDTSPLYWLIREKEQSLLKLLIDKNDNLARELFSQPLFKWFQNKLARPFAADFNVTAFYQLAESVNGKIILKKAMENNPFFLQEIPSYVFAGVHPNGQNTSILYWLSGWQTGRFILKKLIETNPKIVDKNFLEGLFSARTGTDEGGTALIWLTINLDGVNILKLIFEQLNSDPLLMMDFFKNLLKVKDSSNKSPFFHLTELLPGRELLHKIQDMHPYFAGQITADMLLKTINYPSGKKINDCPLSCLIRSSTGVKLLMKYIDHNPDLAFQLFSDNQFQRLIKQFFEENLNLIFILTLHEGAPILHKALKINPKFLNEIPAEVFYSKPIEGHQDVLDTSVMYWLVTLSDYSIFKNLIGTYPGFINEKFYEALFRTREHGSKRNASCWHWLTKNPTGQEIIAILIRRDPDFALKLTAEVLCKNLTESAGSDYNTSSLFWLSSTTLGQSILRHLFLKNPSLIDAIPIEAWSLKVATLKNECPLSLICKSSKGIQLLSLLPKAIQDCAKDLKEAGSIYKIDIFSELKKIKEADLTYVAKDNTLDTQSFKEDLSPR